MYTLKDAHREIEKIDNDIEKLLRDKEAKFTKTQPQAVDPSAIRTKGCKREDKFFQYASYEELKMIDEQLDVLYTLKNNCLTWIEKELKILGKYNDLEKEVIYYKEEYIPKTPFEKTWNFISSRVHASESTCKRIYRKYKNQRNI